MTETPRTPFTSWRHWRVADFFIFGVGIVVGVSVGMLFGERQGWMAGGFAGTLAALVRISWPLRKERWFWGVATFFAAADALAVSNVDWSFTQKWNGHEYTGLLVLDLGLMMAIVYGMYRLRYGTPAAAIDEEADEPAYSQRDLEL